MIFTYCECLSSRGNVLFSKCYWRYLGMCLLNLRWTVGLIQLSCRIEEWPLPSSHHSLLHLWEIVNFSFPHVSVFWKTEMMNPSMNLPSVILWTKDLYGFIVKEDEFTLFEMIWKSVFLHANTVCYYHMFTTFIFKDY